MCLVRESNPRHKDFQSFALPTELTRQVKVIIAYNKKMSIAYIKLLQKNIFQVYSLYVLTNSILKYIIYTKFSANKMHIVRIL